MQGRFRGRVVAFTCAALMVACVDTSVPSAAPGDAATQAEGGANGPSRPPPPGELAPGPIITPPTATKPSDASIEAGQRPPDAASDNDGSVGVDARVVCGDGRVDTGEACDTGKDACCNATCTGPGRVGATCRASAGACDVAEVCDGTDVACPGDVMQPLGHVCRAASGACDVAEICNGVGPTCPNDAVAPDTFQCGTAGSEECDADDFCDGTAKSCPDLVKPNTATCGSAPSGACDAQDHCAGVGTTCTPEFAPSTTTCGSSVDTECDNPDTCDGAGNCQVNNEPNTTNCGDQGVECHVNDKCKGDGTCEDKGFLGPGTACGDLADCVIEECNADATCVNTEAPEADGYACYVGGVTLPDPTNGQCSTGTCCPGATTNQGPTTCGFRAGRNVVFLASQPIPGMTPGGIADKDQLCNTLARGANLGGDFHAWLSTSQTNARDRIGSGPYVDVSGRTIANDKPDLTDGMLTVPIEIVEMNLVGVPTPVWTGTNPDGTTNPANAGDWTIPVAGPALPGLVGISSAGPERPRRRRRWRVGRAYRCRNARRPRVDRGRRRRRRRHRLRDDGRGRRGRRGRRRQRQQWYGRTDLGRRGGRRLRRCRQFRRPQGNRLQRVPRQRWRKRKHRHRRQRWRRSDLLLRHDAHRSERRRWRRWIRGRRRRWRRLRRHDRLHGQRQGRRRRRRRRHVGHQRPHRCLDDQRRAQRQRSDHDLVLTPEIA